MVPCGWYEATAPGNPGSNAGDVAADKKSAATSTGLPDPYKRAPDRRRPTQGIETGNLEKRRSPRSGTLSNPRGFGTYPITLLVSRQALL
jgi:hypothetical protein